jgi:dephospho-CoA kinase
LKKVAVTGGLASGKTTVCQFFKNLGACVVSADEVVHRLLSKNTSIIQQVVLLFGKQILEDGAIDRGKLAEKVFSAPDQLKALEKILHPAVLSEIDRAYKKACGEEGVRLFVAEVPLLYEAEMQGAFDCVIVVDADPSVAEKRSYKMYRERIGKQLPVVEKKARADYVIFNNGSKIDLKAQVEKLYTILSTF